MTATLHTGEIEVQVGFGFPLHSTVSRVAYTPSAAGYVVYDTDEDSLFSWDGSGWVREANETYLNANFVTLDTIQTITGAKTIDGQLRVQPTTGGAILRLNAAAGGQSSILIATDAGGVSIQTDPNGLYIRAGSTGSSPEFHVNANGTATFDDITSISTISGKFSSVSTDVADPDATLTTKDYVDGKQRFLPYSFNGVLADAAVVAQFVFPIPGDIGTTPHAARCIIAPSGGVGEFDVKRNGASIGTISFADGATTGTVTITATAFVAGDVLQLETVTQNGMSDPTITLVITTD